MDIDLNHLLALLVAGVGLQEDLLDNISKDWGQADEPVVLWILLVLFLNICMTFAIFQFFQTTSLHHDLSTDRKQPYNDTSKLP